MNLKSFIGRRFNYRNADELKAVKSVVPTPPTPPPPPPPAVTDIVSLAVKAAIDFESAMTATRDTGAAPNAAPSEEDSGAIRGNEIRETLTTERRERSGKTYIVVNHAAWYPADKFTEATAAEDYISTHENGGWNFIPRRH